MTDLSIVPLEVADVLKCVRGEELDEIRVGCSKHVTAIAE